MAEIWVTKKILVMVEGSTKGEVYEELINKTENNNQVLIGQSRTLEDTSKPELVATFYRNLSI